MASLTCGSLGSTLQRQAIELCAKPNVKRDRWLSDVSASWSLRQAGVSGGTLKASDFDGLIEQLDKIKTLAVGGAMDEALAACANAVKSNFKAAKRQESRPQLTAPLLAGRWDQKLGRLDI